MVGCISMSPLSLLSLISSLSLQSAAIPSSTPSSGHSSIHLELNIEEEEENVMATVSLRLATTHPVVETLVYAQLESQTLSKTWKTLSESFNGLSL